MYLYFQPQYLFVFVLHANKVRQHLYLVGVHDAEGLLELLDGGVGEGVEDVGLLGHLGGVSKNNVKMKLLSENLQFNQWMI